MEESGLYGTVKADSEKFVARWTGRSFQSQGKYAKGKGTEGLFRVIGWSTSGGERDESIPGSRSTTKGIKEKSQRERDLIASGVKRNLDLIFMNSAITR